MGFNSLQYFIDYVSKHPEFNNIQVTNLRSNTAYIVDKVSKMFVPTNQADAVKTLTTDRMDNIMEYHEMYAEKIPQKTDNRLNELKDDFEKNPDRHYSDTRYTLYKNSQKFNEVKNKSFELFKLNINKSYDVYKKFSKTKNIMLRGLKNNMGKIVIFLMLVSIMILLIYYEIPIDSSYKDDSEFGERVLSGINAIILAIILAGAVAIFSEELAFAIDHTVRPSFTVVIPVPP